MTLMTQFITFLMKIKWNYEPRHEQGLDISELETDTSFVIQKLVKDLKGIHSFNLFRNALI